MLISTLLRPKASAFACIGLLLLGVPVSLLAQTMVVSSQLPAANAITVVPSASLALTFSQNLNLPTASKVAVYSAQAGGRKAGTYTAGGTQLRFDPTTDFKPGETVYLTVPATVQSATGVDATPRVSQFTTAASGTGRGNFQYGSDPQVQDSPCKITAADIDNDGDLDLISANYGSGNGTTVSVLPNDGKGNFGTGYYHNVYGNNTGVIDVAAADVDIDGDLDIVTANANTGNVSVLINYGYGYFMGGQSFFVGGSPRALALADLDDDGDLDVLTANDAQGSGNSISVRFNSGTGHFSGTTELALGQNPSGVAVGDVDNDGDLDLLASIAGTNSVAIRLNDGTGQFSGSGSVPVGPRPSHVAVADLDADGNLDLLTSNFGQGAGSTVSVRLNDGKGHFMASSEAEVGAAPTQVTTADVDADGDLDLLTSCLATNTVSIRLNDGTGRFSDGFDPVVDTNTFTGVGSRGLATGDLDGDGDIDLLAANSGNTTAYTVSVRLNQPPAPQLLSFSPASGAPGTTVTFRGTSFTSATAVLFNGVPAQFTINSAEELTAVVPAAATTGPVSVTSSGGTSSSAEFFTVTGSFTVSSVLPTRNYNTAPRNSLASASFDKAVGSGAATLGALRVHSQQAGGYKAGTALAIGNTITFRPTTPYQPGETVTATLTTAARSAGGRSLAAGQVFQFTTAAGVASGSFPPLARGAVVQYNPLDVAAADMNGDGRLDIVTLNYAPNGFSSVSVRLNNGNATFGGTTNFGVLSTAFKLVLADVDNDGDLDALTVNDSRRVSVRLNNGTGTAFSDGFNVPIGEGSLDLVAADVNADGYPDMLTANSSGHSVSVRLNNSGSGFVASPDVTIGNSQAPFLQPVGVGVADVDLDGDLDMITANQGPNSIAVRLNDGTGVFSGSYLLTLPGTARSLRIADVNNDGIQDALVGFFESRVQVLLGNGAGGFTNGSEVRVGNYPRNMALGDIDGDGDQDLVTANADAYSVSVRRNDGTGRFSGSTTLSAGQNPAGICLADLDGDEDLDLLLASYSDGYAGISLNPAGTVTSVQSAALAAQVSLYPNPAHQRFSLVVPAQGKAASLTLTLRNSLGQIVRTQTLRVPGNGATVEMDAAGLPLGVYTLHGTLDQEQFTKRVVLE
ncbi:T9SS C-terminal target domain-containing protein [Hymenobacter sediminis]|uniref:FG-GAP-like repeat-containing protein n=1 Tax=Hymenobacter sediminis TaxID=2218621 RepID=UPI000F4EABCC|nr:FG-GAP-like repeat-containing protein [Hymenobacter sediminis]RPD47892.1 T9SS C-terminal target domain-containing protein [Hymenobacter sediminis]